MRFMTKTFTYIPKGVCSRQYDITVADGVIEEIRILGGCHGNLQGISSLLKGMKVEDAIARMDGIDCRGRGTSCPDQIAQALKTI
jgi:uncharacterized protein (TIGR03905 family)